MSFLASQKEYLIIYKVLVGCNVRTHSQRRMGEEEHQTTKATTAAAIIMVELVTISLSYANSFKYKEIIDVNTH